MDKLADMVLGPEQRGKSHQPHSVGFRHRKGCPRIWDKRQIRRFLKIIWPGGLNKLPGGAAGPWVTLKATGQTRRKVGSNGPAGDTLVFYVTEHGSDTALLILRPVILSSS